MYCPKCALQNVDDSKFCRTCGTNLEVVALALADRAEDEKEKNWLEKRGKGVRLTAQGAILTGFSLLVGLALALFSNNPAWMVIWLAFFGWMACWGVIALMLGYGNFLEASIMLRHSKQKSFLQDVPPVNQLTSGNDLAVISNGFTTSELPAPLGVTEQTTRSLDKKQSTSKHTG